MLEAKGITARTLFTNLSLTLPRGHIHGLSGPSGSGKTTLGRIIAGLQPPAQGHILLDGAPLPERGPSPVQYLHQSPLLAMNPRWTIHRILTEGGPLSPDIPRDWLPRHPHELSGGQLQRVAIARALATTPRYLIADEITAALDPLSQAQIWAMLDRRRAAGLGILAISHDAPLLARIAQTRSAL